MEPIVLVALGDPEQKPRLYACPKCGAAHSPGIYLAKAEVAHAAARDAAANCYNCREHNTCSGCGEQCEKSYTKCASCRRKAAMERAQEVPLSEIEECFSFDGDGFYHSTQDASEAGETMVYAATFRPFRLDADSVIDGLLEDHFDDASEHDLIGADELRAAIDTFNRAQTCGTYDVDRTRRAAIASAEAAE